MSELLLLRHAKSSWDEPGLRDHDRPLNERGRQAAPRMGRCLADHDCLPDRILSSTAVRARETAEAIAAACGDDAPEVATFEELYLAPPSVLLDIARRQSAGAERVLVVAHNPGLEELVSRLARTGTAFPTAAPARFELDLDDWDALDMSVDAKLLNLWLPRELDG